MDDERQSLLRVIGFRKEQACFHPESDQGRSKVWHTGGHTERCRSVTREPLKGGGVERLFKLNIDEGMKACSLTHQARALFAGSLM